MYGIKIHYVHTCCVGGAEADHKTCGNKKSNQKYLKNFPMPNLKGKIAECGVLSSHRRRYFG